MKITLHITRLQSPLKGLGESTQQQLVLEADSAAELHQGMDQLFSADHATGLREQLGLRTEAANSGPELTAGTLK